jgi:preprotein translocase subunit YajC
MMNLSGWHCLLAQQTQLVQDPAASNIKSMVFLIVMVVVMWVLIFLPQRKKTKELEALVKSLKAGDKVVTSGGIVGIVLSIKDRSVAIRSGESKLEVLKSTVTEVSERSGEAVETKS